MDSTANDEPWDWVLSPRADDQFEQLDHETRKRIAAKLDEVMSSEWRDPADFLEPLTGSPFEKLRIGEHRLGCRVHHEQRVCG